MITNITVTPLNNCKNSIRALATVTVDSALTIYGIAIKENQAKGSLFVVMPQKRTTDGQFIDVVHPIISGVREELNQRIIGMYTSGNLKYSSDAEQPEQRIKAQYCDKYQTPMHNSLARVDLVVGDFVVHNAKIVAGKNDSVFLSLPSYKDKNGEFHSIVAPSNPDVYKIMNREAILDFNREYNFRRVTADEVSVLKQAKIPCLPINASDGNMLIKYQAENATAINDALNALRNNIVANKI